MKCERLHSLVKAWYINVQEEAMAPARMVAFMDKHISLCETCLLDPDVRQEADKIREIVLPPSRAGKDRDDDESSDYDDADVDDVSADDETDDDLENDGDSDDDDEDSDDDDDLDD